MKCQWKWRNLWIAHKKSFFLNVDVVTFILQEVAI